MKLKGVRGQGKLGKSPPASTKLGSTRRAGPESLGYPGDHDVESSAVQTSGGQGSEVVVVLDREMCEELLSEVGVVMAEKDVVFSVEEDHVLFDSAELP
ncbi:MULTISPECIES: hypothetical protein [Corynebacterium]|nr:hypothetical protein [Corynebacterium sanguinis]MCT1613692.1 hypothetical protein [Corynebacterium sanguinis]MCT1882581.1 hypothetical protein [Corynebacterium sanguinis]MCT2155245.1 hypothetical protein [Corynebacterium sanguinis]